MKYYAKSHEWVEIDGEEATIGISRHAADELGDLTYVELPEDGMDVIARNKIGSVESVKAASDIFAPISGTVCAVNSELEDDPAIINDDPEKAGWICKLDNFDETELDDLMNEEDYAAYLKTL